MMDMVDIAWVAGIIEGEGSFSLDGKTSGRITVKMTDYDIIERLQTVTNTGTIYGPYKKAQAHHKPAWHWKVYDRREVARLLLAIYPLMGERRRERIAELTDRIALNRGANGEKTHCLRGHPFDEENTYWSHGKRWCIECRRLRQRTRREAKRLPPTVIAECPQGHPYDEANTRVYNGRRHCRACDRMRPSRYKSRKPSEAPTNGVS